jgi:uncharacterized protein
LGWVIEFLVILAVVFVATTMSLYVLQRRLIYRPDETYRTPADAGLQGVEIVTLEANDGARLVAWYAPAAPGKPTFLYFHGNAGGLITRSDRIRRFADAGYGVFMPSYRGYSGSTGSPSETAIISDATLAYNHLLSRGVAPQNIVLYGESLGTGVAVRIGAEHQVAAVVLDSPYTSLVDIAKTIYRIVPVETFMVDRFDSMAHIGQVHVPLLVMHGRNDVVIPLKFSEALFEAANNPKERVVVEGAGHTDIYYHGAFATLRRFVDAHTGRAAQ